MKKIILLLFLSTFAFAQFHPNYRSDLQQKLLDLSNNYVILNINLKPGDEDINAIAGLRFAKGFKIFNLYITRGELENDISGEYFGDKLGEILSQKAKALSQQLDIENYFLNLRSREILRNKSDIINSWGGKDSISNQIASIIRYIKPDIIVISGACRDDSLVYAPYYDVVKEMTVKAVSDSYLKVSRADSIKNSNIFWNVRKIYSRVNRNSHFDLELIKSNNDNNANFITNYFLQQYNPTLNNINKDYLEIPSFYETLFIAPNVKSSSDNLTSGVFLKFSESDKIESIISNLLNQKKLKKDQLLKVVQRTDAVIDLFKNTFKNIGPLGNRILSKIKFDLSEIRLNLLDIKI